MIPNRYAQPAMAQGLNAAMQPQRPQYSGLGASAFGPTPMIQPEQLPAADLSSAPMTPEQQAQQKATIESRKAILTKAMGK